MALKPNIVTKYITSYYASSFIVSKLNVANEIHVAYAQLPQFIFKQESKLLKNKWKLTSYEASDIHQVYYTPYKNIWLTPIVTGLTEIRHDQLKLELWQQILSQKYDIKHMVCQHIKYGVNQCIVYILSNGVSKLTIKCYSNISVTDILSNINLNECFVKDNKLYNNKCNIEITHVEGISECGWSTPC